ncbi:MAG: hypothetical protein Q9160_001810 [Pyrenula sp. 1 TL-2023]
MSFRRSLSSSSIQSTSPACLLVTFDAFGTLIRPRFSIAEQYLLAARDSGLLVHRIPPNLLFSSFKRSIKEVSTVYPNYKVIATTGPGSAREWWNRVIWQTFAPFIKLPSRAVDMPSALFPTAATSPPSSESEDGELRSNALKMEQTCDRLWSYFSGRAYEAFTDVQNLFARIQTWRNVLDPGVRIVTGIISNTDDRMPGVIESLGLMNTAENEPSQFKTDNNDRSAMPPYESKAGPEDPFAALEKLVSPRGTISKRPSLPGARGFLADSSIPFHLQQPWPAPPVPLLDFVLTSHAAGHMKPNPAIFAMALHQATAKLMRDQPTQESPSSVEKPSRPLSFSSTPFVKAIHIGDDPSTDVEGALSAGWDAVLLDRKSKRVVVQEPRQRTNPESKLESEPSAISTLMPLSIKAIHTDRDPATEIENTVAAGLDALLFERRSRQVAGQGQRLSSDRRPLPPNEDPLAQAEDDGGSGYRSYGWRISDKGNDKRSKYDGMVPRVISLYEVASLLETEVKNLSRKFRQDAARRPLSFAEMLGRRPRRGD